MQIHAWCVMDNHFHLLYQTGKTSLAEFMCSLLTVFIAVKYLGMDVKEAGKILNIKNAAGSMALKRGMAIEKVKGVAQKLKNCRLKN